MNSREFLEALKKKSRTEAYDVLYYFRLFASISRELVSREKLDPCTQCQCFLRGLPESVLMNILYRYDIDLEDDNDPGFEVILEKVLVLARCRNRLAEFTQDPATGFVAEYMESRKPLTPTVSISNIGKPSFTCTAQGLIRTTKFRTEKSSERVNL